MYNTDKAENLIITSFKTTIGEQLAVYGVRTFVRMWDNNKNGNPFKMFPADTNRVALLEDLFPEYVGS